MQLASEGKHIDEGQKSRAGASWSQILVNFP